LTAPPCHVASFRKPRFRLDDFFSRLWLFIARRRSSLPPAVTLNRFLALLDVLIFGISLHPRVLCRTQNHHHVAAVEEGLRFDLANVLDVLGESQQEVAAPLRMGRLATPEHDRHLHLGALVQEAFDVALLGVVVVDPRLRYRPRRRLDRPPLPQRAITKLASFLSVNDKTAASSGPESSSCDSVEPR